MMNSSYSIYALSLENNIIFIIQINLKYSIVHTITPTSVLLTLNASRNLWLMMLYNSGLMQVDK